MSDQAYSDKSYNLPQLLIYPSTGQGNSVDVTNLMMELTKFEDMFATCRSGELILNDALDLISTLPITGFDYLQLVYGKPGLQTLTETYRIYKIDRHVINNDTQANQVYSLRFCSEEMLLSVSRVISKSYKGKTATDMVKDVLQNHLKVNSTKIPDANFETTTGVFDIIIPTMSPFRAINMMTHRSIPTCVFYENNKGYNFKSINTLVGQQPVLKYKYHPKNISQSIPIQAGIDNVIDYEFLRNVDVLKGVTNGMFSSRLTTFDLIRWKTTDNDLHYDDFFKTTKHLEVGSFENGFQDRFSKDISDYMHTFVRFYPTTFQHNTDTNITSRQSNIHPNLVEQWMLQNQSVMEQLHYFKIKLVVPGTTQVTVGDVIEFGFPLLAPKVNTQSNLNPYYKGRYLITAIRHKINPAHYEMIIEATKDSFNQAYPGASNGDANLSSLKKA